MDSSEQDAFDRARFATVLRNLKRDSIPSFASAVRYSGHPSTGIIEVPTTPRPIGCRLLSRVTCGSYNAVFKVLFADGTLWVLKVPANGDRRCWNAPASEALKSEAYTMRLIRRETTIPVPEVYAFDASIENELGCPFILMELIHGKPLHDVWFDQSISQAMREQIRIRSLQGIAEATAQLNSLTFSQGGSLRFDAKGNVVGIGSANIVDLDTQYANMRSPDYDNAMAFCQTGPFSDPQSYLLSLLDTREGKRERGTVEQGAYKLLRLWIEWSLIDPGIIQGKSIVQERPFVLAHPDLDNQNILVNDDGSLAGIIDWDWIAAVPHCIGPQSLPKFLTQDYDPANYAYDVEADGPKEGYVADSPAQLASYRAMYAQFMESYLSTDDRMNLAKSNRHAARVRKSRKDAADTTRRSLVTTTLHLAANAPSEMRKLLIHLFEEIEELTAVQWQDESSAADSEELDESDEGGNEDKDTEATEMSNSDVAAEEPSVQSSASEENAVNIVRLSIDELVDEIEKLMDISSVGKFNHDIAQDLAELHNTSPAEATTPELDNEAQDLSTINERKEAHRPRVARACGWLQKKLRRGAKNLHKKPEKEDNIASAASIPSSGPTRAAMTFCGWTEKKLRRVAHCLHCDGDDKHEAKVESKVEAVRNGRFDVLKGLQAKLLQLRQNLHRKQNNISETSGAGEEESLPNQHVTSVSKELTRAQKRSVCSRFVHMVQENRLCLTADQQVAVAHWIVQTLQSPDYPDMSLDTAHFNSYEIAECQKGTKPGKDGGSATDFGYEEGLEDGDGNSSEGRGGNEGREETERPSDGKSNVEQMDQACALQPSDHSLSEQSDHPAIEIAGTTSDDEEAPDEAPRAALCPKPDMPVQEDIGAFDLLYVCIALARDNLDERRMQRLRDGFFGLLNQTL